MGATMSLKHNWADRRLAKMQREYEKLAKKARSKRDNALATQYEKKMMVIYNQRVTLAEYEAAHKALMYAALGNTVKAERYEANVQRIRTSYQVDIDQSPTSANKDEAVAVLGVNLTTPSTYVSPLARSTSSSISQQSPHSIVINNPYNQMNHNNVSFDDHERPPAYSPHAALAPPLSPERSPSAPSEESPLKTLRPSVIQTNNQQVNPLMNQSNNQSVNQSITSVPSPMPLSYANHSSYGSEGPTVMLTPASPSHSYKPEIKEKPQKQSFMSNSSAPLVPKKPLVLLS